MVAAWKGDTLKQARCSNRHFAYPVARESFVDVRSQGQSRKHVLALSFSGFDPKDGVIGRPSLWIAEDFGCCASG